MNHLERLAPRDRRMLLALTEMELAAVRRPELEEARARALLARWPEGAGDDWLGPAADLVGLALGTSAKLTWTTLGELATEHLSGVGLPNYVIVARAVLSHLNDWAALDDAGRQAAIDQQRVEWQKHRADLFMAAVRAHGLPVCAPDLHPPLTWTVGQTNQFLRVCVDAGAFFDTGERRDGWPVYDLSNHEPSLVQPAGDAGPLEDGARNGDLNVIDESSG